MSNTPFIPVLLRRESVQTWVKSQWKNPTAPGHISVEINKQKVLSAMGLDPASMPFFRLGPAYVRAQMARLKQQGLTSAAYAGSGKLYADFAKLDTAAIELSNTLGKDFAPALDAAVRALTSFLHFLNRISPVSAAEKVATGFSKGALSQRRQALRYFEGKGYTPAQAAGMVANIQAESSYNPKARNGKHYGIAQWDQKRRERILAATGIDVAHATYGQQLEAIQWELTHSFKGVGAALRKSQSAAGSAVLLRNHYEMPGYDPADQQRRAMIADRIFGEHPNALGAPRTLPADVNAELAKLRAANGSVTVDINHSNVPAGVTTQAIADGSASIGTLRINRAMTTPEAYP